jgi:hypothetical protein
VAEGVRVVDERVALGMTVAEAVDDMVSLAPFQRVEGLTVQLDGLDEELGAAASPTLSVDEGAELNVVEAELVADEAAFEVNEDPVALRVLVEESVRLTVTLAVTLAVVEGMEDNVTLSVMEGRMKEAVLLSVEGMVELEDTALSGAEVEELTAEVYNPVEDE